MNAKIRNWENRKLSRRKVLLLGTGFRKIILALKALGVEVKIRAER